MRIKDYEAHLYINSQEILDWKSLEVSTNLGDCEIGFNINIGRPLDLTIGDLVTVSDGFLGDTYNLITNKEIEGFGGSVDNFTISGIGSLLTRRAPSKSKIYVNETWLKTIAPGYFLKGGIIYRSNPGDNPFQVLGVSVNRLFIPQLPGKGVKDHEFECVVRAGITYYDIARDIVSELGYTLVSNVPNLTVQKVFAVPSGSTHWNSLVQFFSFWKPFIYVKNSVIYVMDIGGDRQARSNAGALIFTADSFEGYEYRTQKNINAVDHVVIHGPDARNTVVARTLSGNRRKYNETTLFGEEITEASIDTMEYNESAGFADFLTVNVNDWIPKYTTREVKKKIDPINPENAAIIQETVTVKNPSNVTIHQTISDYKWASYKTPVSIKSEKWSRIPDIAGGETEAYSGGIYTKRPDSYSLQKVETNYVTFGDFVEGINQMEVVEETYGLRVYFKSSYNSGGNTYYGYEAAQTINNALMQGYPISEELADDGTGLVSSWGLTRKKTLRFDVSSPYLIHKIRTDHTFTPYPVGRTEIEDIPIYNKQRFPSPYEARWEYFLVSGSIVLYEGGALPTGNFHPKVELSIPDIKDEAMARKVAERTMTGRHSDNTEFTIKTTLPIPGVSVGGTIVLPTVTKRFFNWDTETYSTISVAGGAYWITGHRRVINNTGDVASPQRGLEVFDYLTLKQWF